MKLKLQHHIQYKILVSISICIFLFCFISNLIIATLLGRRIFDKTDQVNHQYVSSINNRLLESVDNLNTLGIYCMSDLSITQALTCRDPASKTASKLNYQAQVKLDSYLLSSPLNHYIERFIIFNTEGVLITSSHEKQWNFIDKAQFDVSSLRQEADRDFLPVYQFTGSVSNKNHTVLAYLAPITTNPQGYVYIELNLNLIADQLTPYGSLDNLLIADMDKNLIWTPSPYIAQTGGKRWYWSKANLKALDLDNQASIRLNSHRYRINRMVVEPYNLSIYSFTDMTLLANDNRYILLLLGIILFTTLIIGFWVSRIVSLRITHPLQFLTAHIHDLSKASTLTVDAQIEQSDDEIGEIGKVINQLTVHINELIKSSEQMFEQKKNVEINLLQSQINPHFLYNTLDSIRLMAMIQKNNGISQTIGSLVNLLRNMAKGLDDKITLGEELALVNDYVKIQQLRYSEIFDFITVIPEELLSLRIVKFTLQPIVENAILHGIEPTGDFGEIKITAKIELEDLYITVEDNGIGMSAEELLKLTASLKNSPKNSLNGIGISNVDARLKLIYGDTYGLSYTSEKNRYTRVTIHIPTEYYN